MFHHRHLKRRQVENWIVLDLRRLDSMMPGMLLEGNASFVALGPILQALLGAC
jgi:hypothetical protein